MPGIPYMLRCFSDASGTRGFGFVCGGIVVRGQWSQVPDNIAYKEMLPLLILLRLFGSQFCHSVVIFTTDNSSVATMVNKCYAKDPALSVLILSLAATFDITLLADKVPRRANGLSDALSKGYSYTCLSHQPLTVLT